MNLFRRDNRAYFSQPLTLFLVLAWSLLLISSKAQGQTQLQKLTAAQGMAEDQLGSSVNIDGARAIIGAPFHGGPSGSAGAAYIYVRSGSGWSQQAQLLASDATADDAFGTTVAISGKLALVGAPQHSNNRGAVYAFRWDGTRWREEDRFTASDNTLGDRFGSHVRVDGDYAVVGADPDPNGPRSAGFAYVFRRDGSRWVQQARLTASDGNLGDRFGFPGDIEGDYLIVGARGTNTTQGAGYIFRRSGSSWIQEAKIAASDGRTNDQATSVAISDGYAMIGARLHDAGGPDAGAAYVFRRDGTRWIEETKLTASDAASGAQFGFSLAMRGPWAVIGAPHDNARGSAYIFRRTSSGWNQHSIQTNPEINRDDRLGSSTSISGSTALFGAPLHNQRTGAAFVVDVNNRPPGAVTESGSLRLRGAGYAAAASDPSLDLEGSYTIELWFKHDGESDEDAVLLHRRDLGGSNYGYSLQLLGQGMEPRLRFIPDNSLIRPRVLTSQQGIPAEQWTHVALVHDGAQLTLYINGIVDNTMAGGGVLPSGQPLQLGAPSGGTVQLYSGWIDEVRIWNTARGILDIQQNYLQVSEEGAQGLITHYRFNAGGDDIVGPNDVTLIGDAELVAVNAFLVPPNVYAFPSEGAIVVQWDERLGRQDLNRAAGFQVYRSTSPDLSDRQLVTTVPTGSNSYTDTNVASTTTYFYQVPGLDAASHASDFPYQALAVRSDFWRGNALTLDGDIDYASLESIPSLDLEGSYTIELWFKHDGESDEDAVLLHRRDPGGSNYGYSLQLLGQGMEPRLRFIPDNSLIRPRVLTSQQGIPAEQWTHVALVHDGAQLTLYINGIVDNTMADGSVLGNSRPLRFGTNDAANGQFYSGLMDEVRIWSTARSLADIRNAKDRLLVGNEDGLIAYWRFDEVDGQHAYNSSGRPLTATLVGDATFTQSPTSVATEAGPSFLPAPVLAGNYPNPVQTTAVIRYYLPTATPVSLRIYDLLGRTVQYIAEDILQQAGWHNATLDATHLPSGPYIYQLETPDYRQSARLVIIK